MKILVIDDKATHLAAAKAQLGDHELTTAQSYDDGLAAIRGTRNRAKPWEYENAGQFDAVLVDLLMPASNESQGPEGYEHVGKEMPVGIFLALLAAQKGAKYVAVLTDSSHHDHPASACFDAFNKHEGSPTPFMVAGAKVILCNDRNLVCRYDPSNLAEPLEYDQYKDRSDTVRAKDWKSLLDLLLDPPSTE
jgi:CheY-like chemotaxis protein